MAAGAGACGAAYWFVPAWNSDMADVPTNTVKGHMNWSQLGYAGEQWSLAYAGSTPLKRFYGNFASTTMTSFQTIAVTSQCFGADWPGDPAANNPGHFPAVPSFAPRPQAPSQTDNDIYYPHISGGGRTATLCDTTDGKDDCSKLTSGKVAVCNHGTDAGGHDLNPLTRCTVTVLDHFTSSFHWAQTNFSAIWLRPQWYLVDNLVLSDVQDGGLSFITSGDYARASVIDGDWAVVRTSILIGHTQAQATKKGDTTVNPSAQDSGPFMNLAANSPNCENGTPPIQSCMSKDNGVSYPLDSFGTGQRLFSIYDGPAYEESNIYLDISQSPCNFCMYAKTPGFRKNATPTTPDFACYLPNAAIGWKQPNGFFYPPSFHSNKLFFDNVDIRHYVIDAPFAPGTYLENASVKEAEFCLTAGDPTYPIYFTSFTDIDRQTELNDDDGTLTGLTNKSTLPPTDPKPGVGTISVNPADYFNAPIETAECLSNIGVTPDKACPLQPTTTPTTAKTSPYDYVTTVVFPGCAVGLPPPDVPGRCGSSATTNEDPKGSGRFKTLFGRGGNWSQECANPACYGVPLYRQLLTDAEQATYSSTSCVTNPNQAACRFPFVRMGGQSTYQRSSLTVNHGVYFLDTSVSQDQQALKEPFTRTPYIDCSLTPEGSPCQPRSVNVFQGPTTPNTGTYYMFFLFAKTSTKHRPIRSMSALASKRAASRRSGRI